MNEDYDRESLSRTPSAQSHASHRHVSRADFLKMGVGAMAGGLLLSQMNPTVAVAAPTGNFTVYNAKTDFGATGNGTTDDTVAIQNALNAAQAGGGGIVLLPPGVYLISSALLVPSGVQLWGHGMSATTIKQASNRGNDSYMILNKTYQPFGGDERIVLYNFTLDGNGANQPGAQRQFGISLRFVRDCLVERVRVRDVIGTAGGDNGESMAFDTVNSTDVQFAFCEAVRLSGSMSTGFSANSSTNISWHSCLSRGMDKGMGFTHWRCRSLRYVDCITYGISGARGFNSEVSDYVTYVNCQAGLQTSPDAGYPYGANSTLPCPVGFYCTNYNTAGNPGSHISYIGCTAVYNSPYGGLIVDGCSDVTIVGGDYSNNYPYGIEVRSGTTSNVFIQAHPILKQNSLGPIRWFGTKLMPDQPDANGWTLTFDQSGKRRWRQRWSVAPPAVSNAQLVGGIQLPIGITSIDQIDSFLTWRGDAQPQFGIVALQTNFSTKNIFAINAWCPTWGNLNTITTKFELFLELVER